MPDEFAEYELLKTLIHISYLIYTSSGITLTQFYINFSRQEHQIELIKGRGRDQLLKRLDQPLPPFIFP